MTIIEQIKAEVERLKVDYLNRSYTFVPKAMQDLLDFISDLEKKEKPINQDELDKAVVDYFEGYWPGMETAEQCNTDLRFTPPAIMRLARHFYELGRQSKQTEWTEEDIKNGSYISAFLQANCGDSVILKRATIWFMSRLKQLPIQQSKPEVCEDVEEASKAYADDINSNECLYTYTDFTDAFKAGAKWQKEQMMKDAVEGDIGMILHDKTSDLFVRSKGYLPKSLGIKCDDNVKLIIVK